MIMKPSQKRIVILILAASVWTLFGASCRNTVRGVGQDVENTGEHIEHAVRR